MMLRAHTSIGGSRGEGCGGIESYAARPRRRLLTVLETERRSSSSSINCFRSGGCQSSSSIAFSFSPLITG
jgi:hypothetical protein